MISYLYIILCRVLCLTGTLVPCTLHALVLYHVVVSKATLLQYSPWSVTQQTVCIHVRACAYMSMCCYCQVPAWDV